MLQIKSRAANAGFIYSLIVLCVLFFGGTANAQARHGRGLIEPGTMIPVRTTENINTGDSNDRIFHGVVDQDVYGRNGNVVIPRGSDAELAVRKFSRNELALDLDSITVNGERYGVDSTAAAVGSGDEGIGANSRTGKYLGGGAAIGAIIGAIAGGGKGAAIGAVGGAAAGAGAQVLTKGGKIKVPSESLLTFRLTEPLHAGVAGHGYRQAYQYQQGYGNPQPYGDSQAYGNSAYSQGLNDGYSDLNRGLPWRNPDSRGFRNSQERQDYEMGYRDGYQNRVGPEVARQKPYNSGGYDYNGASSIRVDAHNNVSWQGPPSARIYVQVDNRAPQLFASGQNGVQPASWISPGHVFTFVLQDANGNEIARTVKDLR